MLGEDQVGVVWEEYCCSRIWLVQYWYLELGQIELECLVEVMDAHCYGRWFVVVA